MPKRQLFITASLPYANGPLHLGHMVEYTQADIWARFQRMQDNTVYFICGSDCHGTPIMLQAEKLGISPEEMVKTISQAHQQDFADFDIIFDQFHSTHSPENRDLSAWVYNALQKRGDISQKTIEQAFDPEKNIFLPDRFVKGTCPKCGAEDQYGDNCEVCGANYSPTDLINPISVLSGATPVLKTSEHYFFDLPKYEKQLKNWMAKANLQKPVQHKLNEWFESGLQSWDISRDAPYFGFKIPDTEDKYFYVWLDAPIGYLASFKVFCEKHQLDFTQLLSPESTIEMYHFLGKDVMYFHALFWPAMLMGANLKTPNGVFVHGYLTINGKKMSKSRGTFIKARDYLDRFKPDYLRYYFAAKLNNTIEDIDLNLEDFRLRVNADLIGKLINIASRTAGFITKKFDGKLSEKPDNAPLLKKIQEANKDIAAFYETRQYSQAMRLIMQLADDVNAYISDKAPWTLAKDDTQRETVHAICTTALNAFRLLMIYLTPVLPALSEKVAEFLNVAPFKWADCQTLLNNHAINQFKPLLTRIEAEEIEKMTDIIETPVEEKPSLNPPLKPEITFDDFAKIDLRTAKIIEADHVEGADKLLRLKVSLGIEERQIFAGIKKAFNPEDLIGKQVVIVANLKPRKMRFGLSEGMMIVASHPNGNDLFLVSPGDMAEPGIPVQ